MFLYKMIDEFRFDFNWLISKAPPLFLAFLAFIILEYFIIIFSLEYISAYNKFYVIYYLNIFKY